MDFYSFFSFFCYDDKHPFKYKYEWLLWANMFLCLFHGHFCLFCLISMYVMTLSLWLHILVERYAACARNINMRRTENDRFTFAGKLM